MNKAESYFIDNIQQILTNGFRDENPRPRYASDGKPAHSIYITQVFEKYDLSKGEFPITELRPIPVINGIKEVQWIYQDQTSSLDVLENKYNIKWWREWDVGNGTIGQRYGATVDKYSLMNNLLLSLLNDPYSRRHILSLWQDDDLRSTGLNPCAFMFILSVRKSKESVIPYLDMTLIQRSSDYLVAGHINKMQYVALQMMIAKHCGFRVGVFAHLVQNLHIYDRHIEQAEILLERHNNRSELVEGLIARPKLILDIEDGTNFYYINYKDFKLIDYNPIKPQLKFDLGI